MFILSNVFRCATAQGPSNIGRIFRLSCGVRNTIFSDCPQRYNLVAEALLLRSPVARYSGRRLCRRIVMSVATEREPPVSIRWSIELVDHTIRFTDAVTSSQLQRRRQQVRPKMQSASEFSAGGQERLPTRQTARRKRVFQLIRP